MAARLLKALSVAASLLLAGAPPLAAAEYPDRPLRLIVPFAPGGGTDLVGRIVATSLGKQLGQTVVVENRGGAGTVIGSDAVAKSAPDGYTILLNGGSMAFLSALFKTVPFDVAKDFRRISTVSEQAYVLTVSNTLPVDTVQELVALAKSKPGELTYVSAGIGSATHLESELLWHELGIKLLHIPYKGTAPAVSDLIAGNVKVMYTTLAAASELIKTNKVKGLAVSTAGRSPLFPGMPTIAETVKPGFAQGSTLSLFVPAATPRPVADKLFDATVKALGDRELLEQYKAQALLPVASKSLEEADAQQRAAIARWAELIKSTGIKAE
ncbi:Tripartite tricarboxylate transporter family receptor [Pigmentiphaga humi]|uniref:Tripartite tricarboxylate transporter family receptor n=1 Tax=Pigmentiphaga humi TaxID=2478468 RepID=A0A3P4B613_9BURK|nr:tripartite tricarboxylate transporter substrate binding protein [Pigmentiphaga humi]VCU71753.1 Tripartite tricarboxylate transporter family receptor [Pigmentiphaga humi]